MFSDILRSKRTLGWRTCLIIPELEHELAVAERWVYVSIDYVEVLLQSNCDMNFDLLCICCFSDKKLLDEIWSMRKLQNELDDKIDDLQQVS